ncbi:unnamed protein product [Phytophthora fragariaefolia]|uniref:Unnamed protein product n=1 Tax=Phytophthora fragariaefolia TaxID=1490495 RepID=A0A9W6XXK2_9STRA|nr:unnamed protein product [Phytophthora fragariaefolia]
MLRTLSPTEQHGVALGFIMKKQREVAARATVLAPSIPRVGPLNLHANSYVGREGGLSSVGLSKSTLPSRLDVSSTRWQRLRSPCDVLVDEQGVGRMDADSLILRALARTNAQRLCTRPGAAVTIPGIATGKQTLRRPAGAGPPAGDAVERVDIGHARFLRALVDCGASNNFVRLQSLARHDFEEVKLPRSLLEVRLAMGVVVRTEKRARTTRFSYEGKKFVDELIVLGLDDKFDMVLGMPWLARHDPVID